MKAKMVSLKVRKGYDESYWYYDMDVLFLDCRITNREHEHFDSYDKAYNAAIKVRQLIETLEVPL